MQDYTHTYKYRTIFFKSMGFWESNSLAIDTSPDILYWTCQGCNKYRV